MDYSEQQGKFEEENFINKNLEKLKRITSMEILFDPSIRLLFKKFIQRGHTIDLESTNKLERFSLCDRIINNPNLMYNEHIMESLLERCETYEQE